ncbi:TniQ family protein [Streptomyces sp. NBC_00012]|uniref:TniQ domain-containing protein n=1 Tax=Streptomyces gelaticus TaxID=285446 RepID=A0ABQ2W323_9ACTN|nr:TniQ family protein [Streptomyces gelaticus]GGV90217.1 hypothetical protein GCM10015535_45800 [Streptomyces gelaticus]
MTKSDLRELPRSLAPLSDESLPGYLLRLSCRLHVPVAHTAARTGLARRSGTNSNVFLPVRLLHRADDSPLANFIRTTRLSAVEATNLFTFPLGDRYGPLNPELMSHSNSRPLVRNARWFFGRWTRYCPDCLTGDGSPIQNQLGGPWKRHWRLPTVFACPHHRALLHNACPQCGNAALTDATNFLPRAAAEPLHPTLCRAPTHNRYLRAPQPPTCKNDLTTTAGRPVDDATMSVVLALQNRLLDLHNPHGPAVIGSVGWQQSAAQYFLDLRAVTWLILLSWPDTQGYAHTPTLADAVARTAENARIAAQGQRDRPGKRHPSTAYTDPPIDPLAAAAVFGIAEQLLATDYDATFAIFSPLISRARSIEPTMAHLQRALHASQPLRVTLSHHKHDVWKRGRERLVREHPELTPM